MIFSVIFRPFINEIPRGLQNVIELIFTTVLDFMESITQDRCKAFAFFPVVFTIFIYVLLSNFIEIVPFLGSVGIWGEHHGHTVIIPFFRSASADLNFTFALAIVAMLSVQIFGVISLGIKEYSGKFFVSPLQEPYVIGTFVGLLELVSEFAKIISFAFRLFGNIFAGEVLLIIVGFIMPYLAAIPFLFLEIFVGSVQALVFSVLTLVFLKNATDSHH
jgi:F-type H+-transporting ATPase subunit a